MPPRVYPESGSRSPWQRPPTSSNCAASSIPQLPTEPGDLEKADQLIERIAVPGVFEIPTAIKFAWDDIRFDGCVTLGCVIRGETDHYDHICREVSRALMDLSIALKIPHGLGIITCENREQAWERADIKQKNIGARAANACLRMIEIRATNSG